MSQQEGKSGTETRPSPQLPQPPAPPARLCVPRGCGPQLREPVLGAHRASPPAHLRVDGQGLAFSQSCQSFFSIHDLFRQNYMVDEQENGLAGQVMGVK